MRLHAAETKQAQQEESRHSKRFTHHAIANRITAASPHSNVPPGVNQDFSRLSVYPPAPSALRPKLTLHAPGDVYEQEADRISQEVMSVPERGLQPTCGCGAC